MPVMEDNAGFKRASTAIGTRIAFTIHAGCSDTSGKVFSSVPTDGKKTRVLELVPLWFSTRFLFYP